LSQPRLDDDPARLDGSTLSIRRRTEVQVGGQLVDRPEALLLEDSRPPADRVEGPHMMAWHDRPASIQKRALIGLVTMLTDPDIWQRPRDRFELASDLFRYAGQHRFNSFREVAPAKEIPQVGVDAVPVQVHNLHAGHVETESSQDMCLDGEVANVVVAHARARLHLDQPESSSPALENINGN